MLKYLAMIQDREKVMNPNMLQAIAKQFEAAYSGYKLALVVQSAQSIAQ